MAVSAHAVANEFLSLAEAEGRALTNMQVQKLVFLAQGYSLALLGEPIYYHNTHAWQWGPVVPKLYKALQNFGSGVVRGPIPAPPPETPGQDLTEQMRVVINGVWRGYGKCSGAQLSELTHRPGSPWSITWESDKFGVISNDEIRRYYSERVERA